MTLRSTVLAVSVLAAGIACSWTFAQEQPKQPGAAPAASSSLPPRGQYSDLQLNAFLPMQGGSQKEQAQVIKLVKEFTKATKEEDKKKIRTEITDLLAKQFDQHMKQQQKELEDLEKQIASVKETMKKRQDSKSTIVDRRVEQLILDADGMGWNVPSNLRPGAAQTLPAPAKGRRE
jgi:hypothetical protein